MAETLSQKMQAPGKHRGEFWLVVVMLGVLGVLVIVALQQDITKLNAKFFTGEGKQPLTVEQITNYNDKMLAHRSHVLSLTITASGK